MLRKRTEYVPVKAFVDSFFVSWLLQLRHQLSSVVILHFQSLNHVLIALGQIFAKIVNVEPSEALRCSIYIDVDTSLRKISHRLVFGGFLPATKAEHSSVVQSHPIPLVQGLRSRQLGIVRDLTLAGLRTVAHYHGHGA